MQYTENSSFLYRNQPSNKRKYVAIAFGVLVFVGAMYYFTQPNYSGLPEPTVLDEDFTPESTSHMTMTGQLRADMLRETNIRRCMHGAGPLSWDETMYTNVQ
jgi:uncharacterized protein YkwD